MHPILQISHRTLRRLDDPKKAPLVLLPNLQLDVRVPYAHAPHTRKQHLFSDLQTSVSTGIQDHKPGGKIRASRRMCICIHIKFCIHISLQTYMYICI